MFDPRSVEAYKNIKAPESLRDRVLTAKAKRRAAPLYVGFGTAVAAGLVAVFLAVPFFSSAPTQVTVGGLAVENQVVIQQDASAPMMARMGAQTSQSVSFSEDVTILSADGVLTDEDYNELSLPYEAKADQPVWWNVRTPPNAFALSAKTETETLTLHLTYDENKNQWTISRVTAE